jgi:hypothetical protein
LRGGRSRGRRKQWRMTAKGKGEGRPSVGKGGLAAKEREKRGATTRVLWEKETTPQMSPDFASNGLQPFPSSTHRRSTFGHHFFGILHWRLGFAASGSDSRASEQAERLNH